MAIRIESATGGGVVSDLGGEAFFQKVNILCDAEDDILSFGSGKGHVIEEGPDPHDIRVKPLAGSTAYTPDAAVGYKLSPSYVWTKFKG